MLHENCLHTFGWVQTHHHNCHEQFTLVCLRCVYARMRLRKLYNAKALTANIWLSISMSFALPSSSHNSNSNNKGINDNDYKSTKHLLCACSVHLQVHFFTFRSPSPSLFLVDFDFHFEICVAHKGNSALHTMLRLHCSRREWVVPEQCTNDNMINGYVI